MKVIIGIIMVVAGIALGLYVGLWVCFVGGIVQIIEAIKAENILAMPIAWGIVKIVFAGFLGTISGYVFAIPGFIMIKEG